MKHLYKCWTTKEAAIVRKMWSEGAMMKDISAELGDRTTYDVQNFISYQRKTGSKDYPYRDIKRKEKKK